MSVTAKSAADRSRSLGPRVTRLRALVRKEFLQIVRDPSSIAIAFLLPVVLLLIFGYGVSLDAEHVAIAVVVDQPSDLTAGFTGGIARSRYFEPIFLPNMALADQALRERKVSGIVRLRSDFARRRNVGNAPIQVILNGTDANTARLVGGYLEGVWAVWLEDQAYQAGRPLSIPVAIEERVWFNSEIKSRDFLVPGLIAIIMTLIGTLLTAMVMAREWERGTMEALLSTPAAIPEILLGKLIPYFILGAGGMLQSLLMALFLFHVPLRGSLTALFASSALFLAAALGMGLLISIVAKNQFVAGQVAILATFLPAFILSGFLFDVNSMPRFIQWITYLIPARYFVAILQTVFLAGDVRSILLPNGFMLLLMAVFFLGLSRLRSRKRLE